MASGLVERVDRYQQHHRVARVVLAVLYKFIDDRGSYLAALIAYYAFVSLFPLLLLSATILGIVLVGHPALQRDVIRSALHEFPVVGQQLSDPTAIGGGAVGVVVGVLGSLYGALGVAQAIQHCMNSAWRVPRHRRPNPLRSRVRSLVLLSTAGLATLGTFVLSTLGTSGADSLGTALKVVVLAGSVAINAVMFLLIFRVATERPLRVGEIAPGAVAMAVVWQLLQSFGVVYVNHVVRRASEANGVFALVLGLIAFFYLAAVSLVLCVEVNVVRAEHLYPRSLLSAFTDDDTLTAADRHAYTRQAEAERMKSFQAIDVTFPPSPPNGADRSRPTAARPTERDGSRSE